MQLHTATKKAQAPRASREYDEADWKAELERRWQALGQRLLVATPAPPPVLEEILEECSNLVVVWALVQARGNLTRATEWIRSSRKLVRRHFLAWRRANPNLIPMPAEVFLRWSERHGGDQP